jgi:hypothetical protein
MAAGETQTTTDASGGASGGGTAGKGTGGTTKSTGKALPDVSWRVLLLVVIVLACLLVATLVIVFHYSKASTTTSVLGVVIPVFTALIGAALGTGAGAVAGAAGKKSSDQQLATANKKLGDTHQQAAVLNTKVAAVLGAVKTGMSSPAGQARFVVAAAPPGAEPAVAGAGGAPPAPGTPPASATQPPPTIEIADLDAITEALARILSTTASTPPVS